MATFSVAFLGCKVSQTDAHEIRERLVADGHVERDSGGEIAVVNSCCVTNEAVAKSRQAARRAARTARRVYVTGCAANLGSGLDGLPENVEHGTDTERRESLPATDPSTAHCFSPRTLTSVSTSTLRIESRVGHPSPTAPNLRSSDPCFAGDW